ncbi:MAG: hypothetical protein AAF581_19840 [Planctomycetota bacterium]
MIHLSVRLILLTVVVFASSSAAAATGTKDAAKVDAAVKSALDWLVRHQSPDGSWSSEEHKGWQQNANRDTVAGVDLKTGFFGHDVGVTGLALLAFVADGHTHKSNTQHSPVVSSALAWLLGQQAVTAADDKHHGFFGLAPYQTPKRPPGKSDKKRVLDSVAYDHAIATIAACELLLLTKDKERLAKPIELALDYVFRAQKLRDAKKIRGWKYRYQGGKSDTSVTAWMCHALAAGKRCADAELIAWDEAAWKKAKSSALLWFDEVISKQTKKSGYQFPGDPGSVLHRVWKDPYPFTKRQYAMCAVNAAARLALGQTKSNRHVKSQLRLVGFELPEWILHQEGRFKPPRQKKPNPKKPKITKRKGKWSYNESKICYYYWYYGTLATAKSGIGWKKWQKALHKAVIGNQRQGGAEKGSWDNVGEWSPVGGRVYNTALLALTLQITPPTKK